jgi:hypothetical protein
MSRAHSFAVAVCVLLLASAAVPAQYGTAPAGYYPSSFTGSTFKGAVTAVSNDEITLTYTKGTNAQTFTGRFEAGCSIPAESGKPARIMMPANIPVGSGVTAFYSTKTEKDGGKKVKENWIVAISIDAWGQRMIAEERQGIMYCTKSKLLSYQAF